MFTTSARRQWTLSSQEQESLPAGLADPSRALAQSRHRINSPDCCLHSQLSLHPLKDADAQVSALWKLHFQAEGAKARLPSWKETPPRSAATRAPLLACREVLLIRQRSQVRETQASIGPREIAMELNRNFYVK